MKKIILSITAVVAMAVTLTSCGGGSTPKATAEKFLNGMYHMDYDAAKSVSTKETKEQLDAQKQAMDMMGGANADATKKAKEAAQKITVNIQEPVVNGDNATVSYTVSDDATHAPKTLKLVKQNGTWLASWTKMDGMGDMGGGAGQQGAGNMDAAPMDTSMAPPADGTMAPMDTTKMAH